MPFIADTPKRRTERVDSFFESALPDRAPEEGQNLKIRDLHTGCAPLSNVVDTASVH
jgi:hypothetical protein